jgi:(p)ppGpp synthase/HD superfamily hydrolase
MDEMTTTQPLNLRTALARCPEPAQGVHLAAKAKSIAALAHHGQVDAIGAPYSGHLARVASRAETIRGRMANPLDRFEVEAAAWLHDVLEDTPVTSDELRIAGIPAGVLLAVNLLTHRGGDRATYLQAITANPLALLVKISDTVDNSDPVRLAAVNDPERKDRLATKYEGQLEMLINATGGTITTSMF